MSQGTGESDRDAGGVDGLLHVILSLLGLLSVVLPMGLISVL